MKELWEQRYGEADYAFGREPNEFFKAIVGSLPKGRMLVPGAGEGRDAVYAATLGWQVDAFDLSGKGKEKAQQLAAERGASINFQITDASEYMAPADSYDAVALIYFHLPPAVNLHLYKEVVKALKPGGLLILEGFNPRQLANTSGGPKDITWLVTTEGLREAFAGMDIRQCEEQQIHLDEGPYHQGVADVVRFVAVK